MDIDSAPLYTVDFGYVISQTVNSRTFVNPCLTQVKEIIQYHDSSCIDNRFKLTLDDKSDQINIRFSPMKPGSFYCGYYNIICMNNNDCYNLCIKGATDGLMIQSSKDKIELKCKLPGEVNQTKLFLINSSHQTTVYQFLVDEDQGDLSVKPIRGQLTPHKRETILLTYKPTVGGIKYSVLTCLLENHAPLNIKVILACRKSTDFGISERLTFMQSMPRVEHTYQYLFGPLKRSELLGAVSPPLVIDKKFIDMGSKTMASGDAALTVDVNVENLSPVDILLRWQQDRNGFFSITPNSKVVPWRSKIRLTVAFNPKVDDKFYCTTLDGSLYWGENYSYIVPFNLSLHLIGNTFDKNVHGWLAEYTKPSRVVMPPAVPASRTWTTFLLRKRGRLPLMFRILPSESSLFRFIPEHGIITDDHQIIIVEYRSGLVNGQIHQESRQILLNTSNIISLDLVASAEVPNVAFPKGDQVVFPVTAVNCTLKSSVQVKNTTRHILKVKMETQVNDIIESDDVERLWPGEQVKLNVKFSPSFVGDLVESRLLHISCKDPQYASKNSMRIVKFSGSCAQPIITCIPEKLDFGSIHRDEIVTKHIWIVNEGSCSCYVKLKVFAQEPLSSYKKFTFDPQCFCIESGQKSKIGITVQAQFPLYNSFEIRGFLCRSDSFSDADEVADIYLLPVNFICHSYLFSIVDVMNLDGEQPNMTKFHLWNILNIDGWNEKLKKCSENFSNESIDIFLPEFRAPSMIRIGLILKNMSDIDCSVNVIKTSICDCPPYATKTGIILERPEALCPHKSQVHFNPFQQNFKEKEMKMVVLTAYFIDFTAVKSSFELHLFSTSRPAVKHIMKLHVHRRLVDNGPSADIFASRSMDLNLQIRLEPVHVSCHKPPQQAMWLYNNSQEDAPYDVSADSSAECFQCLNPLGVVKKQSLHPIWLKITPLQVRKYQTKMTVKLADKSYSVDVIAQGVLQRDRYSLARFTKMPSNSNYTTSQIFLSSNNLKFNFLSPFTFSTRIFQITNNSDQEIDFKWLKGGFEGLVQLTVAPESGTLKSQEAAVLRLMAQTQDARFLAAFTAVCKITYRDPTTSAKCRMEENLQKAINSMTPISNTPIFTRKMDKSKQLVENDLRPGLPDCLCLTVTVNSNDYLWLEREMGEESIKGSCRAPIPRMLCYKEWSRPAIGSTLFVTLSHIFRKSILDVLDSTRFQKTLHEPLWSKYIIDLESICQDKNSINEPICPEIAKILDQHLLQSFTNLYDKLDPTILDCQLT